MHTHPFAVCLLVAAGVAQQALVLPAAAGAQDGTTNCTMAGFTGRYRQQVLIGPSLLGGALGQTISHITVRRDGAPLPLSAGTARWTVRIGRAPFAYVDALSSRFDDNLGAAGHVVFTGSVQLPAAPRLPHRNAATWSAPDAVTVAFTPAYRYAGGVLCIEIEGEPESGSASDWWPVDAETDGVRGRRTIVGQGCGPVAVQASNTATVDARELRADSTVRLLHLAEAGSVSLAAISAGALGSPIELGMFGAPGCWLQILPDLTVPVAVGGDPLRRNIGSALLPLRIPNAPASLGATFYAQWFDLGVRGLSVSNAVKLEIASAVTTLDAAMLTSRRTDAGRFPEVGRVEMGVMPVLRLRVQ